MEYLAGLNESQRAAVEHIEGPTMVIAGAGSGKTRVLTIRIAYMIDHGVDPFNILALTFTNKAAKEMTERIGSIVGSSEAKNITMGTFHSVFSRILRFNADRLGYPQNFTIYDTQDTKSLLKDIVKELNLDDKIYKPSMVYGRISAAKNNLIVKVNDRNLRASIKHTPFVASRQEQWISMISFIKQMCYCAISRMSCIITNTSSATFWWMSTRIQTMRNTSSLRNWQLFMRTFVWLVTMRKVSIPSAGQTFRTS